MDRRIEKAYGFIKRNYRQKLSLDKLAAEVKLSPFYFQRLFKKELNETPAACINRVRLEKAAHLLKAGVAYSMAQVADECGFSSAAVFNRSFKEFYNMSPVAFSKSPERFFAPVLKISDAETLEVEVIFLPDTYIYGIATSITNNRLLDTMEQAEVFCQKNGLLAEGKKIGVLTHDTLHHPDANMNYYVGISVDPATAAKYRSQLFLLARGKYACFSTRESIRNVREIFMRFKMGWLDNSPYTLEDLIAFEEFSPGNEAGAYPFLNRRVYVPVKLK